MNLKFELNGKIIEENRADALDNLADYLRGELHLTGCKIGCREGECGACSVLVDDRLTLACITPLLAVDGKKVKTIEGIKEEKLFKIIEESFLEAGAVQCGFCTPGMAIAAYALLKGKRNLSRDEIRAGISGNICRCTGYNAIVEAVEMADIKRGEGI
ncbi:MAG: (2Fe-2S)-binding protein [Fusobacteriaceae bacterium]